MLARTLFAAFAVVVGFAGPAAAQQTIAPGAHVQGALSASDARLESGELQDTYILNGRAGQHVVIRLASSAFDTYLLIRGPGDFRQDNDDSEQGTTNSTLDVRLPADGAYRVAATSFRAGEQGAYTLDVAQGAAGAAAATPTPSGARATIAPGQTVRGALAAGDATLPTGEFNDTYHLSGHAGDHLIVRLSSGAFDPYLLVRGPGGLSEDNDDDSAARGSTNSRVDVVLPASGDVQIAATSYRSGETGAYTLSVENAGAATPLPASSTPPRGGAPTLTLSQAVSGQLARGDAQLSTGEYADIYTFQGRRGQQLELTLTSSAFDPYVMIAGPNNFSAYNDDDVSANTRNSRLVVTLPADGTYRVQATSYAANETGAYRLMVAPAGAVSANAQPQTPAQAITIGAAIHGALAATDPTGANGARADRYTFQGRSGQHVAISMRSAAFDTIVQVLAPSGGTESNDDVSQSDTNSRLETVLTETGTYTIVATAYSSDGAGAYDLAVEALDAARPATVAAATPTTPATPAAALAFGRTVQGALQQGDSRLNSGEFADTYTFAGRRGQAATIEANSTAFDTYLLMTSPSGVQHENDDIDDQNRNSRLRLVLPEDGEYRVSVTSFRPGETGAYTLRWGQTTAAPLAQRPVHRVFALMVGISDYGGRANNLSYTADDATKLAETLRRQGVLAPESITLTDAEATRERVHAAFLRLAALAGPDDLFLFFYSGHGGQIAARAGGEVDGMDETIVMRDADITDNEVAEWFGHVHARVALIALDSCFSGGFARDVINRPGVMGLFSSEEDLTSAVADKFEAGGYLSHYLQIALGGEADSDGDRNITAGELSAYMHREFNENVTDVESTNMQRQSNYQFLVVDRGAVKIDDPVLALP